jgi:hypothetical protein
MMKIYAVMYSGPHVGTDNMVLTVAESEDQAIDDLLPEAWEWYEQWLHDEDYDEEGDRICGDGPDIWAEEYDPEIHNSNYPGGPPSEKYIKGLQEECLKG